jgi:ribosomal protein S18 acetylase RimI-like enzyme
LGKQAAKLAAMDATEFHLFSPSTPPQLEAARAVFRDYAASLSLDLCPQDVESELRHLPGDYAEPEGLLLLAQWCGQIAGCGAFRQQVDVDYPNACEMKRLYVRPAFRRLGLGRVLARELIGRACQAGYSTMLLDTLDDMETARELYTTLGFIEVPPYHYSPVPGAHYLKVDLQGPLSDY